MASSEYQMAIKIAGEIEKSFYNSTKLTKKELKEIAKTAANTSDASRYSFSKDLKAAEPAFQSLENVSKKTFQVMAAAATTAAAAVTTVTAASMKVGMEFESQMSTVQAISMASYSDMDLLNDKAKELGATTKFTASEVGQGFEYMAMAGWKTQDMLSGIDGILALSAASGEGLGLVSDIVTDAMTAFKLGADQVNHFADVLAVASSSSNTNVAMMGETFKYVAPMAGTLGYSIEDTAVAIGLMANSGIKATQAGTALRSMLNRLAKPTKEARAAMSELNLSLTDDKGEMKSFIQLQEDIREGFKGMGTADQARVAAMLAGQEAMSGLLAIVNASDSDFENLASAINDSAGAAQKMSDIRLDNLSGDVTIMKSAMEGFGIELYDNLKGPARDIIQEFTGIISDLTGKVSKEFPTARRKVMQLSDAVEDFAKPLLAVGGWLIRNPGVIVGTIAGMGTAVTTYKVATGIMSLATSLSALGPAGMAIMGIGGAAAIITGIGTAVKKSASDAKKANLDKHFGNISLSMKDLQEVASSIVRGKNLEQITESITAMGELDGIAEDIQSAADALNKMNWKVSIGLELTETEEEEYRSQAEEYIRATQEYLEQKQFALNLSIGALSDGDLENNDLVDKVNRFYDGKKQELAALGTQLNDAITDAFQDGLLDIDEAAEIAQIQQAMAEIQSAMAGSEYQAGLDLIGMEYGGQKLDADSFQNLQAEIQGQVDAASGKYAEAYKANVSQYGVMLEEGGSNGFSQEEYDEAVKEAKAEYLKQVAELQQQAVDFQIQMIQQAYPELGDIQKELESAVSQQTESAFKGATESGEYGKYIPFIGDDITDQMKGKVDKATQDALGELFEKLQPSVEQLEGTKTQAIEMGAAIPEGVNEGIRDANAIGALSGNTEALWDLIGQETESDEYNGMIKAMQEAGAMIPEEFANAVKMNQGVVQDAVTDMYGIAENAVNSAGGSGRTGKKSTSGRKGRNPLIGHAEGGIFDTPHIAWFAENGPESAIPLDGSKNAISLWLRTGELLGMDGLTGGTEPITAGVGQMAASSGGGPQFVFSPRLNFYGDAPAKEEITELIETEQEKFERNMQQWIKQNGRLSFV